MRMPRPASDLITILVASASKRLCVATYHAELASSRSPRYLEVQHHVTGNTAVPYSRNQSLSVFVYKSSCPTQGWRLLRLRRGRYDHGSDVFVTCIVLNAILVEQD